MFVQLKMTSLAGAAVALVILVDLATGQGPPVYTNYLQAQQGYRGQPLPPAPSSGLYPQRVEYNPKKHDKELEKAIELGKLEDSAPSESIHGHEKKLEKFAKKSEKEFKKSEKDFEKSYGKDSYGKDYEKKEDYESTPAPGMLSSLSNSMSNAWSRFSSLGRSTRSVKNADEEAKDEKRAGKNETDSVSRNNNNNSSISSSNTDKPKTPTATSPARGIDSDELLQQQQQRQNGYIYFKVPKYLVCNH